jgi:ADP-ribose pyrophosphatase YjhB (NUDIX family)
MVEPKFIPKPGQVDYTTIRYAPVVNIVAEYNGKLLIVQRSSGLRLYPGYWNGVSGFLDDNRSIEEKVRQELHEELGVAAADIISLQLGQILLQDAPQYAKTWLVVPVLARLKSDTFTLDWEAQRAQWCDAAAIPALNLMPGFPGVLTEIEKML